MRGWDGMEVHLCSLNHDPVEPPIVVSMVPPTRPSIQGTGDKTFASPRPGNVTPPAQMMVLFCHRMTSSRLSIHLSLGQAQFSIRYNNDVSRAPTSQSSSKHHFTQLFDCIGNW